MGFIEIYCMYNKTDVSHMELVYSTDYYKKQGFTEPETWQG